MHYADVFVLLRDHDRLSINQLEILKAFLVDAANAVESGATAEGDIYYSIAGLFATSFASSLPEGHPLEVIMTIAGELEANPPDADILKLELVQRIRDYAQ